MEESLRQLGECHRVDWLVQVGSVGVVCVSVTVKTNWEKLFSVLPLFKKIGMVIYMITDNQG